MRAARTIRTRERAPPPPRLQRAPRARRATRCTNGARRTPLQRRGAHAGRRGGARCAVRGARRAQQCGVPCAQGRAEKHVGRCAGACARAVGAWRRGAMTRAATVLQRWGSLPRAGPRINVCERALATVFCALWPEQAVRKGPAKFQISTGQWHLSTYVPHSSSFLVRSGDSSISNGISVMSVCGVCGSALYQAASLLLQLGSVLETPPPIFTYYYPHRTISQQHLART